MKVLLVLFFVTSAFAAPKVLLRDIGVMGLASHDLFTWDRENEVNTENGRLDLSTIFDYKDGKRWKKGGNPKNGENAPVWAITKKLVNFYKSRLKATGGNKVESRLDTVKLFHKWVEESFVRLSGLEFPTEAIDEQVTNTEQAAMRGLHDILPGKVYTYKKGLNDTSQITITKFSKRKYPLNEAALNQEIAYFNGDYDKEYKEIKIPIINKIINLKEVDGRFIETFSPYKLEEMLGELEQVGLGIMNITDVSFIHHIGELFQKGLCGKDNPWIDNGIDCK